VSAKIIWLIAYGLPVFILLHCEAVYNNLVVSDEF
jgi:hypothetical protein